jgi:hypothetical protein
LRKLFVSITAWLLSLTFLAACSGASDNGERPLRPDEASLLAEVLSNNYELEGAHFRLIARSGHDQLDISIEGDVDWKNHRGYARVTGGSQPNPVVEVWWDDKSVAEWRPTLEDEVRRVTGDVSNPVLVRDPDQESRRLDQLLALVIGLSARTPENAQLILQEPDSAFLRKDSIRNQPVLVFRYGKRTVYWIHEIDKTLLRFEGNNSSGQFPVLVDFEDFGPKVLTFPKNATLVKLSEYTELSKLIPVSP